MNPIDGGRHQQPVELRLQQQQSQQQSLQQLQSLQQQQQSLQQQQQLPPSLLPTQQRPPRLPSQLPPHQLQPQPQLLPNQVLPLRPKFSPMVHQSQKQPFLLPQQQQQQSLLPSQLQQRLGLSGPKRLIIPRSDDGFGFTLRQLVTEPPVKQDVNGAPAFSEPLESFHVSSVKKGSNAELAGLQAGDRIVAVDGWSTTRRTFADVVQQMQSNYGTLQLLVVPRDEDALQLAASAGDGPTTSRPTGVDETGRSQFAGSGTGAFGLFATHAHLQSPSVDLPPEGWGVRRDSRSSDNYVQLAGYYSPVPSSRDQPPPLLLPATGVGQHSSPPSLRGIHPRAADPYYVPPPRAQRALTFAETPLPPSQASGQTQGLPMPTPVHGQSLCLADSSGSELQLPQHLQVVRATVTSVAAPGGKDSRSVGSAAGPACGAEIAISTLAERDGALHSTTTAAAAAAGLPAPPMSTGTALSYQVSAPRLPQQIIRAPAQALIGPSQNGRLAGNGFSGASVPPQPEQQHRFTVAGATSGMPPGFAGVRYLPAYGNDGSVADPVVYRAHRTGAVAVGQRPVTSAFESLTAAAYRDTAAGAGLQQTGSVQGIWTADAPQQQRPGSSSWHAVLPHAQSSGGVAAAADSWTESARWLQASGAAAVAPSQRSPVQQETTFDTRGSVVERRTFVYEPAVSGAGNRGPASDGRSWPPSAGELRCRVASDNDLLAARPYPAASRAADPLPPSLTSASSSSSLQQQQYGAVGGTAQQQQPAAVKASASFGSLLLLQTQQQQPPLAGGRTMSGHLVSLGGSGGGRDRLPSEAPGMIYNHGFAYGPATSSSGLDVSAIGDQRVMPKGTFFVGGSNGGRMRPVSYAPPISGNMYAVMEHDATDSNAAYPSVESQSLDDLRVAFKPGRSVGEPQSGVDDNGRAQIIRRTSYMIATASAQPRPNEGNRDAAPTAAAAAAQGLAVAAAGRQPARRPDFLGDTSGFKYPVFGLPSKDGSAEIPPTQHRIATVGQPCFDLQSPGDGTPSTPLPPSPLPITKEGPLAVKFEKLDGKKSTERSWKVLGVLLCGRLLYFVKERKENYVLNQASDDIPVNLRNCKVDVAYGYTKKKYVFRVETSSNSEYLFQAESQDDMMAWIRAFLVCSEADKTKAPGTVDLIMQEIEQKLQSQSPVPSGGKTGSSGGGGGSSSAGGAAKRLAVLPFWGRQQSPGSDSSSSSKKDRRAARLLRGASSPASLSAAGISEDEGSGSSGSARAFGIPLADCAPSEENKFIPKVVEQCTRTIEENGLEFTGLYRIPGNSTAVGTLQEELNCGVIDMENDRWRDVNVVGSLLKLFFRKLPEPLVTAALYKSFIDAHRIEKYDDRMNRLKQLIHQLPPHNFETFKHLANHLKKVASLGHINKMDAHNLAIVFGPTLLHPVDDSMLSIVADMAGQCGVIETVISHNEWIFSPIGEPPPEPKSDAQASPAPPISETMLSMGDDIARLASKQAPPSQPADANAAGTGKKEHFSSLTSAAARFLRSDRSREKSKQQQQSEQSLTAGAKGQAHGSGTTGDGSTGGSGLASSSSSDNGDHGFAERNIDEEVAARRQRFRAHEARQQQQQQQHGDRPRVMGTAIAAAVPASSGATALWSRAGAAAPQPSASSAEPQKSKATLRSAAFGSASDDRSALLLYSDVAAAGGRRVVGRSVSRWHSEESVLDQQHQQHLGHQGNSGSSLWLQLPITGFAPPRSSAGSSAGAASAIQATGSGRGGSGESASGATPSPPPPPLPVRRYRTASQEDALAGPGRGGAGSNDDAVYLSYFAGLCDRDDFSKQQPATWRQSPVQSQWSHQGGPPVVQPSSRPGGQQQHRPALPQQPRAPGTAAGSHPTEDAAAACRAATGSRKGGGTPDSTSSPYAPTYQNVFAQALAAGDYAADSRRARAHQPPQSRQGSGNVAVSDAAAADHRRAISVDSTHSGSDHSSDLLAAITATFDQKLQRLQQRDDVAESDGSASTDGKAMSTAAVTPASAASSSASAEFQPRPGRPAEPIGSLAVFGGSAGSGSEHSFRDPSLNKSLQTNTGRTVTTMCDQSELAGLQQQPNQPLPSTHLSDQSPAVQSAKIGIASRIERTDMKPAATQASNIGAAAWAASGHRRQQQHQNYVAIRAGSYDSLADIDLLLPWSSGKRSAASLSKEAAAGLGSREGLVRSVVDKFEQRSLRTAASGGRVGGVVHGSRSVSNLSALGDSRDESGQVSTAAAASCISPPARHRSVAGVRRRQRRRHTIGGNLMDDYVEVAAAVELATAAARQQQQQHASAWERLQPMVRQYEGAAPRSLHDWMASERERVRGSFSDIYGLQPSSAAADSRGRQYSRVSAGSQPNRQT